MLHLSSLFTRDLQNALDDVRAPMDMTRIDQRSIGEEIWVLLLLSSILHSSTAFNHKDLVVVHILCISEMTVWTLEGSDFKESVLDYVAPDLDVLA